MRRLLLLSALTLGFASTAPAGESDLDCVSLGERICGPTISIHECRGKVTLVEFWGIT